MYPRTNYELIEADFRELLDACQSTRAMMVGSYVPASPQENANKAWRRLGEKMGFDYTTVRPRVKGTGSFLPCRLRMKHRKRIG